MPHLKIICSIFAEKKQTVHLFDNNILCFMYYDFICDARTAHTMHTHTHTDSVTHMVCSNFSRFYLIFVYMWVYIIELQSIQNGIWIWHTAHLTLFPGLFVCFLICLFSSLRCCRHECVYKNGSINGNENKQSINWKKKQQTSLCKAFRLSILINLWLRYGSRIHRYIL